MSIKYRTGQGTSASDFTDLVVKVGDTLPIGTEVDYDGQTAPAGWQEVDDPNVYSTTEQVIGTWVDGKPLYRTVINAGTVTTSNTTIGNIPNIDKLVSIKGSAYSSQFNQKYGIPNVHSDMTSYYINLLITGDGVVIRFGSGLNQLDNVFAIVEYTKTTD